MSYLSECAELHDNPDWILRDDSHQLHNVGVVKLPHGHWWGRRGVQRSVRKFSLLKALFYKLLRVNNWWQVTSEKHTHTHTRGTYMLLGETFPWRCLMLSSYTSLLPQTGLGSPASNRRWASQHKHRHSECCLLISQHTGRNLKINLLWLSLEPVSIHRECLYITY